MNKTEKLISVLLGLVLCWWVWHSITTQKKAAEEYAKYQAATQAAAKRDAQSKPSAPAATEPAKVDAKTKPAEEAAAPSVPDVPETLVTLSNSQETVTLSTWGAVVKKITLRDYRQFPGEPGEDNPETVLDFSESPMTALQGAAGIAANAPFEIKERTEDSVTFANASATRRITLKPDYVIELEESFASPAAAGNSVSLGVMQLGTSKNDVLSVDSMPTDPAAKGKAVHYDDEKPYKQFLRGTAGGGFGCGGSQDGAALPPVLNKIDVPGSSRWIAVKNRFFVTALARSDQASDSFSIQIRRNEKSATYALKSVSASARFAELPAKRTLSFYAGPKKQKLLWELGMKDVMEFGMWRWLCYPLVSVLNFFHGVVPSYGIAIILLTFLVRILFWPLTHKSTVGMRKMQEIQPLMKEIQAKYKDNPQRLQQETWSLYKEHHVNPMSSCLPMLVQIPVFIALFTVLRSAVELRYAPFLWIADLSEPEGLFSSWFPFGGLNVLPILMAVSTALQSAFTPTSGDAKQQRMMMVFMPLMMLFMFYSFPSALSLYWFLSNLISIAQMWWIRKKYGAPAASAAGGGVEVVDMPQTRQMRRHQDREG